MEEKIQGSSEKFIEYRYNYLHQLILIYNEQKQLMDCKLLSFSSSGDRRRQECNKLFIDLKRKRDSCSGNISKSNKTKLNSPSPSFVRMGKPIMVNPNSYAKIKVCIDLIKQNLEIGNKWKWVFLGSDGPTFCLMSRLIDRDPSKYDWAAPFSGLGHLNMNQIKTF